MLTALIGLPRWLKLAGIGALAVILLYGAHRLAVRDAVSDDRQAVAVEVLERNERAGEAAQATLEAHKTEVEQVNDDARKAASGSDDPLRAGLDSLRK